MAYGVYDLTTLDVLPSTSTLGNFNAAMTTISNAGGGLALMPNGVYSMAGSPAIQGSVDLLGAGPNTIIDLVSSPTFLNDGVYFTGPNSSIENLTIRCTEGDFRRIVDFRQSGIRLTRVWFEITTPDLGGQCTAVYGTATSAIESGLVEYCDVTAAFTGQQFDGILINNHKRAKVRKNVVHDVDCPASTRFRWAIYASGDSQGCVIEDNEVYNVTTGGIQQNKDAGVAADWGRKIRGNVVYDVSFIGLAVDSGRCSVTDNEVSGADLLLSLGSSSEGCKLESNTFTDVNGATIDADDPMLAIAGSYHYLGSMVVDERGDALAGIVIDADFCEGGDWVFGATSPRRAVYFRSGSEGNRISGGTIGPGDDLTSNRRVHILGTRNTLSDFHAEVPSGSVGYRVAGTGNRTIDCVARARAGANRGWWVEGTGAQIINPEYSGTWADVTIQDDSGGSATIQNARTT